MRIRLLILLLGLGGGVAFGQTLQVQAVSPQGAIVGENYTLLLTVSGGTAPYHWRLQHGDLPPGLKLRAQSGKISGVPAEPGEYRFTIAVSDSSTPQLQAQREITIHVIAGLEVDWKEIPAIHGNSISGSAVVTNQTGKDFDLTVIIVAVNQIGRATTLGYQHFKLAAQSKSTVIPFASSPGAGTYYVRADAAAHQPNRRYVYRASKQTAESIKLPQF